MWENVLKSVVVGVITAGVLAVLAWVWNYSTGGGLVRALNGITVQEFQAARNIPVGAVVAFDLADKCPRGWVPFKGAFGRVIIGTGKGDNLTNRQYRSSGGAEAVALTADQIPEHQHDTQLGAKRGQWGLSAALDIAIHGTSMGPPHKTAKTSKWGAQNPRAVPTMPPFIALRFCKNAK